MKVYGKIGTTQQTVVGDNVIYTPAEDEILMNGERPGPDYVAAEGGTWMIPAPTLDEAKAAKIAEFKSIRDAEEIEPITTDKGIFDYDENSRDRLSIARQALEDNGGEGTIEWTTADNQRVPMGVDDFKSINNAAAVRSNTLHVYYNVLKDDVNACTTVEEVNAIEWVDPL